MNEDEFLNKLEQVSYKFVIYDIEPFLYMKCMIADIIKDNGAIPYALVSDNMINEHHCSGIMRLGMEFNEIEEKLQGN